MRLITFFILFLAGFTGYGQVLNDTVYYKSGYNRPCEVLSYDTKNVRIKVITQKGKADTTFVTDNKMKYFVVYDSSGVLSYSSQSGFSAGDSSFIQPPPDSIPAKPFMLSINPFALPVLGVNIDYTIRFGSNLQYGIHFPVRVSSPILWNDGVFIYAGIGFKGFVVNNEKFSMTLAATPTVYSLFGEDVGFGLPMTVGFVRYFTPQVALSGYAGAGPGYIDGHLFTAPQLHIGLAFTMGAQRLIKNSR